MIVDLSYLGKSEVQSGGGNSLIRFAPNLSRPKTFFDGAVKNPVRFREAMSALHDVVIGDLRAPKKDRSAWKAWKEDEARKEGALRETLRQSALEDEARKLRWQKVPPNLEAQFRTQHGKYWKARRTWAEMLRRNDPELFRHLVPCDPVVTVAPDVVLFECFAKDESSYGCLVVDRDSFSGSQDAGLGTTNVDYSMALYEHFQTLRSYRQTRLLLDPGGFDVKVDGRSDHREEKIDLPPSWLKGFGQITAAMSIPSSVAYLSVESVYSVLAFLKRHRETKGPRCIRFNLVPGKNPELTLEPWGLKIVSKGTIYDGDKPQEIKIWGRRRLMSLARVLPLADRIEVHLLGNGLPSIWNVYMGEMRFVLGLSGWTANDWTRGAALDLLSGTTKVDGRVVVKLEKHLMDQRMATLGQLMKVAEGAERSAVLGALQQLARQGQVIYDFPTEKYRYRPVMPVALSEAVLGPEAPELAAARALLREGKVELKRDEFMPDGRRYILATVGGTTCEAMIDDEGVYKKAHCSCSFFHQSRLRMGPCRHLMAMRFRAEGEVPRTVFTPNGKEWVQ